MFDLAIIALREVSDKEPTSIPWMWASALTIGAVGYLAARWRWWMAIPFVLLAITSAWAFYTDSLSDRFIGPAIFTESGSAHYMWHWAATTALLALFPAAGAIHHIRSRKAVRSTFQQAHSHE